MGGISMFPPRASANAGELDALYMFLVVVSVVMTVAIFFFVTFFAIKYRRRDPDYRPKPIHGSIPLEIAWSVSPFLVMLIMFAWGTRLTFAPTLSRRRMRSVFMSWASSGCGKFNIPAGSGRSMNCTCRWAVRWS